MTFAARLREIAEARQTTPSGVARALGITPQAVGQWGKPGGTMPTGAKLKKLADFLRVTEGDLFLPVGAPILGSRPHFSVDPPEKSRLVNQPDQLALLEFWDSLEHEERMRVFRILRAAVEPISKRS